MDKYTTINCGDYRGQNRPGYHSHGGGLSRTDQDTTIGRLRPREQIQFHLKDQEQGISSIPGTSSQIEDHFGGEENISHIGTCRNLFFKISRGGCHVPNSLDMDIDPRHQQKHSENNPYFWSFFQ